VPPTTSDTARLLRAGLTTALCDGLFSSALSAFAYGSSVSRLFQGVASVPLGPSALEGGTRTALVGVLLHVCVAFAWSFAFMALVRRAGWMSRLLASPFGVAKAAALYGPFVWMVMSLAVIPAFTHRAPPVGFRWWVQWFGHIPFVGAPIAAAYRGIEAR
jgi:hypothetical protein